MTERRRLARLQEDMQRVLAEVVEFDSRDPIVRAAFPTVMEVRLSQDARHAKVYVAAGAAVDRDELLRALVRDQGFYRSELAQRLPLRHTPEIRFVVDQTVERSLRLEQLLRDEADA